MKLDDLINKLQALKNSCGNVDVVLVNPHEGTIIEKIYAEWDIYIKKILIY